MIREDLGDQVVMHFMISVSESMGANLTNTLLE